MTNLPTHITRIFATRGATAPPVTRLYCVHNIHSDHTVMPIQWPCIFCLRYDMIHKMKKKKNRKKKKKKRTLSAFR